MSSYTRKKIVGYLNFALAYHESDLMKTSSAFVYTLSFLRVWLTIYEKAFCSRRVWVTFKFLVGVFWGVSFCRVFLSHPRVGSVLQALGDKHLEKVRSFIGEGGGGVGGEGP